MIVSNKQISVAIISLFFVGIIGYFFFWVGYVEIFINDAEVEFFQVISREKTYECDKNPCRIKIRAGAKFLGQVDNDLLENKIVSVLDVPLFKTEKVILQTKAELAEAKIKKITDKSSLNFEKLFGGEPSKLNSIGPILIAENEKFAIFLRKFDSGINIFIKTKNSEQLLTQISDDFLPIFLEKNFSLTNFGIVIPAKNRVYYYDFATQRKFKILEMNSLRVADISVSKDAEQVVFYNIKEKLWQKYFINSQKLEDIGVADFAGFLNNYFLEVRENIIYINGKKAQKIPLKNGSINKFYISGDGLILEQDFDVWKIAVK